MGEKIKETGEQVRAEFPPGLAQKAQYGNGVKVEGVYMSERYTLFFSPDLSSLAPSVAPEIFTCC